MKPCHTQAGRISLDIRSQVKAGESSKKAIVGQARKVESLLKEHYPWVAIEFIEGSSWEKVVIALLPSK